MARSGLQASRPATADEPLRIGPHELHSRLIVGTGKYTTLPIMRDALDASGTDCVTVAVRRMDLGGAKEPGILDFLDRDRYRILPNTAGCYTAEDAVRVARLAREAGWTDWVKLEVLSDLRLLPDPIETLHATETLVAEGFTVLVYTSDDPALARRLESAGAACVMPLGSPIGSGQGMLNPENIRVILDTLHVPVIVDAGVGTASDVSLAMELGAEGVLLNTGIAEAQDPVRMARAMKHAMRAGRDAYLAGRIPRRPFARPSSPQRGRIEPAREVQGNPAAPESAQGSRVERTEDPPAASAPAGG